MTEEPQDWGCCLLWLLSLPVAILLVYLILRYTP